MRGALLALIALSCAACTGADNRQRIAMATLYPDYGSAGRDRPQAHAAPILAGALNSKFPPGTDLANLTDYVAKLDGECHQDQSGQNLLCSMVESGGFCAQTTIEITARIDGMHKIGRIDATRVAEGC